MRIHISLDFETYSEADLTKVGAYAYSCHPSTEVLCMAYAVNDEQPKIWLPDEPWPHVLSKPNIVFHAWNAFFERCIWQNTLGKQVVKWDNTQAHAMALSLPRALGECGAALGFDRSRIKDQRGKYLIQRLCSPYRGKRIYDKTMLEELYHYCKQDVIAERAIANKLIKLSNSEHALWELDQKINWRGVPIDETNVDNAIIIYQKARESLLNELKNLTKLDNPNSRDQFFYWLQDQGYDLPDVRADTLREFVKQDLPDKIKQAVGLRLQLAKTPVSKYEVLSV